MTEKIKKVVEEVLKEDEYARDNDVWLILQVLRRLGFGVYIKYSELEKMPSFETITRCRRMIQNSEHHFEPSDKVLEHRGKLASEGMTENSQLSW